MTGPSPAQVQTVTHNGHKVAEGEVLVKFHEVSAVTLGNLAKTFDLSSSQPLGHENLVTESNENNNCAAAPVKIQVTQ
jgi:hypothetical protein